MPESISAAGFLMFFPPASFVFSDAERFSEDSRKIEIQIQDSVYRQTERSGHITVNVTPKAVEALGKPDSQPVEKTAGRLASAKMKADCLSADTDILRIITGIHKPGSKSSCHFPVGKGHAGMQT